MSVDTKTIEYRDIPQHKGYQAGSDGTIWSCLEATRKCWKESDKRVQLIPFGFTIWRKLKPKVIKGSGRLLVGLYPGPKWRKVHHLVLEAFVGPCPKGMEACHFPDPFPENNALSNLRWDTKEANYADSVKQDRTTRGERNAASKIKESQAKEIYDEAVRLRAGRKRLPWGFLDRLAEKHGVDKETIGRIANGKSWKYLLTSAANGPLRS